MQSNKTNTPLVFIKSKSDLKQVQNYLNGILVSKKLFQNANATLHNEYEAVMKRPIYTRGRYGLMQELNDYEFHLLNLNSEYKFQEKVLQFKHLINQIKLQARMNVLNSSHQKHKTNFTNQLPNPINPQKIISSQTFDNLAHLSALHKPILGPEHEVLVFVHDTDENVALQDLIVPELLASNLIQKTNGRLYISKETLMLLAKNPVFKQKMRFFTSDFDWSLSNYRASLDLKGKPQLFNKSKSTKTSY